MRIPYLWRKEIPVSPLNLVSARDKRKKESRISLLGNRLEGDARVSHALDCAGLAGFGLDANAWFEV